MLQMHRLVTSYDNFRILLDDVGLVVADTGGCITDSYDDIVREIGICDALTIFDKLAMTDVVNRIIRSDILPDTRAVTKINTHVATSIVINHTLVQNEIIRAYANGLAPLPSNTIYVPSTLKWCYTDTDIKKCDIYMQNLLYAIANGLCVRRLKPCDFTHYVICNDIRYDLLQLPEKPDVPPTIWDLIFGVVLPKTFGMTNNILKSCLFIENLDASYNSNITTCAPFANTLRVLDASNSGICDAGLKLCRSINTLNASNNLRITTCAPFAESLRILYASTTRVAGCPCGIDDDGLKMCKNITKLYMDHNIGITTCKPFAESLRVLSIRSVKMRDSGISMCHNIEELYACNNQYITTCAPFAKTLHTLFASGKCGINDNGLQLCTSITTLDVRSNYKITTCNAFAKSLRNLTSSNNITDYDSCASITNLTYESDYAPLDVKLCAKSLKKLSTIGGSWIYVAAPDGLNHCKSITELDTSCMCHQIPCDSFAKTLRKLIIGYDVIMDDHSLRLCDSIEELCIRGGYDHDNITTCAPFAKSLRKLISFNSRCKLDDNGLALCTSIVKLHVHCNPHITTCAPFAKTLRELSADSCGITDDGLKTCTSITWLISGDNPNITTCDPFIHTLRKLYIGRHRCRITDGELLKIVRINSAVTIMRDYDHNEFVKEWI